MAENSRRRPRRPNYVMVIACIVAVLVFGVIVVLRFGLVSGQEFSPDTFVRRQFHYYRIPLVNIQISPIVREETTGSLEGFLVSNKYLKKVNMKSPRWDLIQSYVSLVPAETGDARILSRYFDEHSGHPDHWRNWTKSAPNRARIFWPLVADLSRVHLYILLPDLFRMAESEQSDDELQAALNRYVADECRDIGRAQQRLGNHRGAVELLTISLKYVPDYGPTLRARAESHDALEQPTKAAEDRRAAESAAAKVRSDR